MPLAALQPKNSFINFYPQHLMFLGENFRSYIHHLYTKPQTRAHTVNLLMCINGSFISFSLKFIDSSFNRTLMFTIEILITRNSFDSKILRIFSFVVIKLQQILELLLLLFSKLNYLQFFFERKEFS